MTDRVVCLVLGAAGFIGRHVCKEMANRKITVYGIGHGDWAPSEQSKWGISRWLSADISMVSMRELTRNVSVHSIIHCGGSGAVSSSYASPFEDYARSVNSTTEALEFARTIGTGKSRVVLASSAAVYGDQGDTDATEMSARSPISPYGFHKLVAETLCDSYCRFFDARVSVVRLFSVYGEGLRKQLLWDASKKFSRGEFQFLGTGHELRDWLHVEDAARLLADATRDSQPNFEIYNGGNEKATTRHVLTALATQFDEALDPNFSGETHTGNPRRLTSDCGHAHRLLGWTPKVSLREGVPRYAAWFSSQLTLEDRAS